MKTILFILGLFVCSILPAQKSILLTSHDGVFDVNISDTIGNRVLEDKRFNLDTFDLQSHVFGKTMQAYNEQADALLESLNNSIDTRKMRGALAAHSADNYQSLINQYVSTSLEGTYMYYKYSFVGGVEDIAQQIPIYIDGYSIKRVSNDLELATFQVFSSRLIAVSLGGDIILMAGTGKGFKGEDPSFNIIELVK